MRASSLSLISFALAEDKPVDIWANQENKKKEDLTIDKKVEEQKPKINLQKIESRVMAASGTIILFLLGLVAAHLLN